MAAHRGGGGARGFREMAVGQGHLQTARERFGSADALGLIQTRERSFHAFDDDSDDDSVQYPDGVPLDQVSVDNPWNGPEDVEVPLETRVPMMQHSRNNLTALSQKYNLYFAAYGNRIFVYRPRDVPNQRLPQEPDLILATMPDVIAKRIGGHQDTRLFHQSNAIQIGSLGRREVLVLVYDDGSVFAYHVDDIAAFIEHRAVNTYHPTPRPFLHENVGSSAWGIAIHQTSRLIAVSSNRYEVTVFAFGLTHPALRTQVPRSEMAAMSVATRKRTWRIVLLLGANGHNIPNISFWDDKDGLAEKVCAMDIRGNTWVLDIWKPRTAPFKLSPAVSGLAATRSPGWGALVLPHTSFVAATDISDAVGLRIKEARLDAQVSGRLDITQSLRLVRDNPAAGDPSPAWAGDGPPTQAIIIHGVQTAAGINEGGAFAALQQLDFLIENGPGFMSSDGEGDDDDEWFPDLAGLNTAGLPPPSPPVPPVAPSPQDDNNDSSDSDDGDAYDNYTFPAEYVPEHLWPHLVSAPGPNTLFPQWTPANPPPPVLADIPQPSAYTPSGMPPYPPGLQPFKVAADKDLSELGGIFDLSPDAERSLRGELVYIPSRGGIFAFPYATEPRIHFFRRRIELNLSQNRQKLDEEPLRPSSVLRTYVADLELSNSSRSSFADVGCRNPAGMPSSLPHAVRRLHMLIHVPELSLVVVGSAVGRVILLTPTRVKGEPIRIGRTPDDPDLKYGFRVDWVLPRAKDEAAAGRKAQLYGVAVGPVQEGNGSAGGLLLRPPGSKRKTAAGPGTRRYRLMMHFRDHSIMTYDLSRDGEGMLNIM